MANVDKAVRQAMEQCAQEFVRGVHSFNPQNSDVKLPDDIVMWLKNDRNLIQTFTELFEEDGNRWTHDGPVARRSAFHAGSLAALHAYSTRDGNVVTRVHVIDALKHISAICTAGIRVQYKYCQLLPMPS